jgi:preprotein translocase subunit Sec63
MEEEKSYNAFMVNRGLSYFPDTILFANEMNQYHHIGGKLQYDFLINTIRKRNRFSKWNKSGSSVDIDAIKQYYGYSNEKARDVLPLLSKQNLKIIKERISHGGVQKG